jgi:hypothetical protein
MNDLLAAHRHSSNHRAEIEASTVCGCFHCLQVFPPDEIIAWTGWDAAALDDPQAESTLTALCPRCGSESVIGDRSGYPVNAHFLSQMQEAWYRRTIIMKPGSKR